MSAQTVFSALDYLNRWTRARAHSLALKTQVVSSKSRAGTSVSGIIHIDSITNASDKKSPGGIYHPAVILPPLGV